MGAIQRLKVPQRSRKHDPPRDGETIEVEEEEEPVTPAGRVFLHPDFYLTAVCIVGFENPIDLPAFKDEVKNTLAKHRRLSSLMRVNGEGREVWVRTQVEIDNHVVAADLSQFVGSPTIVEDYAAELSRARLDPAKPLWEIHVLDTDRSEARSSSLIGGARGVCVFVFHHALGDGTSLMSLFLASTRQLHNPSMLPTIPRAREPKDRSRSRSPSWSSRSMAFLARLWTRLLAAWFSVTGIVRIARMQTWHKDSRTPLRGYRGAEIEPSHLAVLDFKLADFKRIKNAADATVNDVLLAIVSIALQRYLAHHMESSSQVEFKKLTVRALVMANTRPSPGLKEVNEMMHRGSKARWGNSIGYMLVPLSVNEIKPDSQALDHVNRAKAITSKKKLSCEANFTYSGGALLVKLFGVKVGLDMTYKAALHTTLSVSNIVGPAEAVTFAGNPVLFMVPTSAGLPQGLIVHMTSYISTVKIALMANRRIITDIDFLSDCFQRALETLLTTSFVSG